MRKIPVATFTASINKTELFQLLNQFAYFLAAWDYGINMILACQQTGEDDKALLYPLLLLLQIAVRVLTGKVAAAQADAEDLTEDYVDTEARMKTVRASEKRLQDMKKQAVKRSDLLLAGKDFTHSPIYAGPLGQNR